LCLHSQEGQDLCACAAAEELIYNTAVTTCNLAFMYIIMLRMKVCSMSSSLPSISFCDWWLETADCRLASRIAFDLY
jgi:hypothetical protein